jgi:hypothetical protein
VYISGDSSSLYNSIKLIQPRETEILNPLTFSYSTSPFSRLYMHIHPVGKKRKEKEKKRITTTTIRVCQTVGLKLMSCLSLSVCGGFHIEKEEEEKKNKMMARFASLLFETPGGSLPPYIPPPPIPLTLAELTHTFGFRLCGCGLAFGG